MPSIAKAWRANLSIFRFSRNWKKYQSLNEIFGFPLSSWARQELKTLEYITFNSVTLLEFESLRLPIWTFKLWSVQSYEGWMGGKLPNSGLFFFASKPSSGLLFPRIHMNNRHFNVVRSFFEGRLCLTRLCNWLKQVHFQMRAVIMSRLDGEILLWMERDLIAERASSISPESLS